MDLFPIALFSHISIVKANDPLDSILLQNIIPSIGSKCKSNSQTFTSQTSTHTFDHYTSPSHWDTIADPYEQDLFLAEMSNANSGNQNKSWTLRVGTSGSMYSFRGAYGEAMPPQYHEEGQWVDEVTQSVSVNLEKNGDPNNPYFIHQSGVYMRDGEYTDDHPFFSPNIAKSCNDKECLFGSWGQHAHLPTFHKSDLLYFTGYRDCGDGIIEFTSVFHNANSDLENGDQLNYLNTPWGGVRTTTLRDVFTSNPSGNLEVEYPLLPWGPDGHIINLQDTAGFTTFAEQTIIPEDKYNANPYEMPSQNGVTLQIVIAGDNQASKSNWHSSFWSMYCMRVPVIANFTDTLGCQQKCNLLLTNSRTGESVFTRLVLHWSWAGDSLYFCTDGEIDSSQFNEKFAGNDEIIATYANIGKPMEDNLALTFIHGVQSAFDESYAPNRLRVGKAGHVRRDYTVYTTNSFVNVNPGDTYVYQQFIATGEFSEMESIGAEWKEEVYEDIFSISEMSGSDIHLYSNDENSFGAYVEGGASCLQGVRRCSGKSVPQFGSSPLFAMTCGTDKYVGFDKYYFSPSRESETDTIRSYACAGYDSNVRPTWKLLGFFEESNCDFLQNAAYDSSFCSTTMSPTLYPSLSPSNKPSTTPTVYSTSQPSTNPSVYPSEVPTLSPSEQSSLRPSPPPSTTPSKQSSVQPSMSPSMEPSMEPSMQPSMQPSMVPSMAPSMKPSMQPSMQPSMVPSIEPSIKPSMQPSIQPTEIPTTSPFQQASSRPSTLSSTLPSKQLSVQPSIQPIVQPSTMPSKTSITTASPQPSFRRTENPSHEPSEYPSLEPSFTPSIHPTRHGSLRPSINTTKVPSIAPSNFSSSLPSNSFQPSTSQYPTMTNTIDFSALRLDEFVDECVSNPSNCATFILQEIVTPVLQFILKFTIENIGNLL